MKILIVLENHFYAEVVFQLPGEDVNGELRVSFAIADENHGTPEKNAIARSFMIRHYRAKDLDCKREKPGCFTAAFHALGWGDEAESNIIPEKRILEHRIHLLIVDPFPPGAIGPYREFSGQRRHQMENWFVSSAV
jgi:hypothetical protein